GKSRLVNCPFEIYLHLTKSDGRYHVEVRCGEHNHPPGDALQHAVNRRLKVTQWATVEREIKAGVTASTILTSLRLEEPQISTRPRDIYNIRRTLELQELGGRTSLETLLDKLQNDG
ncbi:hypothetical protein DFS34DRAFT_566505, partial [Phlyctochytrium arcticum]